MNFSISKDLLIKLTTLAEPVVLKNPTLPSISNILIRAKDNRLSVISTDLEVGIVISVPLNVKEEGEVLVNPRTFNSLIMYAPAQATVLEKKENTLSVSQKDYESSLQLGSFSEFPNIPEIDNKDNFTMPVQNLLSALSQVENSVSVSEMRVDLNGVLFQINKDEMIFTSTDGFRLSEKKVYQKNKVEKENHKITIPIKTIQILLKVFSGKQGDVDIYIEGKDIFFINEEDELNVFVMSNTIQGDFPKYESIIPKDFISDILVSSKDLEDRVKAGSVFSSSTNDVKIDIKRDDLIITSKEKDKGDFKTSIKVEKNGKDTSFSFNYQYLLDGLSNIKESDILIKISDQEGPILIQGNGNKDYFYILMPIREN